ncbi:TetR family transcriptional regulator [Promicromonospora thailandica]|uniref:Transcriptional regulator, TetR family n=1 Tax=Promicromonospora thailandica TaxID=765201 RepID=A0A9X2G433_9MICO|nr:TetR family transcriptional regulator [Promicromonospora thailandica]MCP2266725.1 transcriptional regulator, TetR family [Promicromonospora thailandica]BFF21880.1 TetR family transcriptional regulator [Promicromonospora thailandica]
MTSGAETEAPRRRSDATRAAILAAARDRFAADGYERATVRAIAHDAGIDPSMVMRYFGSKEDLFAAVIDVELDFPDPSGIDRDAVGVLLVRHFLELWERDGVLRTLLRVGVTNAAGADRLRDVFRTQLVPMARELGHGAADAERRAALVASQVLGMALVRYVLALEPAAGLSHDDVVAWLAPTVQRYLTAEAP